MQCKLCAGSTCCWVRLPVTSSARRRSEEHTSELQSQSNLVCRLLLEKKKKTEVKDALITRHLCSCISTSNYSIFLILPSHPPRPTRFPYTTLFRSRRLQRIVVTAGRHDDCSLIARPHAMQVMRRLYVLLGSSPCNIICTKKIGRAHV